MQVREQGRAEDVSQGHMPGSGHERVIVTGGAGFLGSRLSERLHAAGHDVIVLDNLSSGHRSHLSALTGKARFHFVEHDIIQPLPAAAEGATQVCNLACPASPPQYQARPVQTVLTGTVGLWHLLEATRAGGGRLLQASTSEVYGDPEVHPQTEDYVGHVSPIGVRSCYDEAKRCGEAMCMAYHREHGLPVRVARIFNSYGPRLRPGDGRVVSNFIVQALSGQPLTVYGDGSQTRSFCHVDDTVEGLLQVLAGTGTGPYNIGNPRENTVLELAELVLRLTHSSSRIEWRRLPQDDPRRRRPDLTRTRADLGWSPRIDLAEGLRDTIAWFRLELGMPERVTFA